MDDRGLSSRVISNSGVNPTRSPDGKSILYSGGPGRGLFRSDISGENPVALKTSDKSDFRWPVDWSGDVLLFNVFSRETKADIWSAHVTPDGHLAPGAAPVPYLQTGADESAGRFAPGQNQKWLAYQSDESGRQEVYVRSFPTKGEKFAISNHGGNFPVWGPGGRELFYRSSDDKIMVADVQFGPSTISASVPREVFPLPTNDTVSVASPFDTIDGQRFLVLSSVAPVTRPLQVIENWQELLKH
jgi:Tol biopolymer transport system component